jgi:hypothetical protein
LDACPGTGKTSTIKACALQLYGSKYKSMVLEVSSNEGRLGECINAIACSSMQVTTEE